MTEKEIYIILESWDNFELLLLEINAKPELLPILMKIAIFSEHKNSWRALYLADKIHDSHPERISPYVPEMIEQLQVEQHNGKKRHLLKLISMNTIDEEYSGFLMDYCLTAFTSSKEPVANRVHAMQILYNISETEPDIKAEVLEIIQQEIDLHPTPGIRARGRKLVRKLQKQLSEK